MDAFATDCTLKYLVKDDREGYSELEHLPPLLEDEENVSLADVLSLRDSCLLEEEVWAMSGECVLALQSIQPSHLFHSLCITPDTLAFNAHGNVCFMEQLSDDVEGLFVPPEFDNTGSTFEGHLFSLGSTLSAALDFVIEPELRPDLGAESRRLLEQMQAEQPGDRPHPQEVLALVKAKLTHTSSAAVCRKLTAVGRRMLSLEPVSNLHGAQQSSWEARWQHATTRWQHSTTRCWCERSCSEDGTSNVHTPPWRRGQDEHGGRWDPDLWSARMDEADEDDGAVLIEELDWTPPSSPGGWRLKRSNTPPTPPADISVRVSDLTEIGADERSPDGRLGALERGQSCEGCPVVWERPADLEADAEAATPSWSGRGARHPGTERRLGEEPRSLSHGLHASNNHMTKSMLCLNEESQDEWSSLREMLTRCGRRLRVHELWALCYTCLAALQSYTDFPACLCLDTVYVGCKGEVLFLKPKNIASCDVFYLAPEYQEHGIMTEKACVYGVAAILWATAKFRLSPAEKLAMPCKLKRLLLEMARRTAIERPSIVMAKKVFLSGTNIT